jgi:hypothetical protein
MSTKEKYTVILPTYNERRNLPIICWLLEKTFTAKFVYPLPLHSSLQTHPNPNTPTLPAS